MLCLVIIGLFYILASLAFVLIFELINLITYLTKPKTASCGGLAIELTRSTLKGIFYGEKAQSVDLVSSGLTLTKSSEEFFVDGH